MEEREPSELAVSQRDARGAIHMPRDAFFITQEAATEGALGSDSGEGPQPTDWGISETFQELEDSDLVDSLEAFPVVPCSSSLLPAGEVPVDRPLQRGAGHRRPASAMDRPSARFSQNLAQLCDEPLKNAPRPRAQSAARRRTKGTAKACSRRQPAPSLQELALLPSRAGRKPPKAGSRPASAMERRRKPRPKSAPLKAHFPSPVTDGRTDDIIITTQAWSRPLSAACSGGILRKGLPLASHASKFTAVTPLIGLARKTKAPIRSRPISSQDLAVLVADQEDEIAEQNSAAAQAQAQVRGEHTRGVQGADRVDAPWGFQDFDPVPCFAPGDLAEWFLKGEWVLCRVDQVVKYDRERLYVGTDDFGTLQGAVPETIYALRDLSGEEIGRAYATELRVPPHMRGSKETEAGAGIQMDAITADQLGPTIKTRTLTLP